MLSTDTKVSSLAVLARQAAAAIPRPYGVTLTPARFDQDDPSGTTIGDLAALDFTPAVTHTFELTAAGEFLIDGVHLKTATTFADEAYFFRQIPIKVESSNGQSITKDVTVYIDPVDTSNDTNFPPEPPVQPYGQFDVPPFIGSVDGVIKLSGKNGGVAKIIIEIDPPKAGKYYEMKYRADWSQLSNLGKEAFVGFGFVKNEDFHFGGFKGDGAAGVRATTISGAGKLHGSTGFTYFDGGAMPGLTQSGPNWARSDISSDGQRYTLSSSADDGDTFAAALAARLPAPLVGAVDATKHGIAIFLENSDKGPFFFQLDIWESNAAGYGRGYGLSYGG